MAQPYNEIIYQFKKSHSQKNLFHNKAGYKIILYTIPICKKKNTGMHKKNTGKIQNKMLTVVVSSW